MSCASLANANWSSVDLESIFSKPSISSASELYDEYNILTFYGSNIDLPLKISCPLNTDKESLDYFLNSMEKILNKGTIFVVKNFIKKNIFK